MAASLPERPNPEQLRKLARDRRRESGLPLHVAQLDLARHYGFASWPRLAAHIDALAERTWSPPAPVADEPAGDRVVRLACLTYSDAAFDPAAAADLAAEVGAAASAGTAVAGAGGAGEEASGAEGAGAGLALAATTANAAAIRAALAAGVAADTLCGPFGWPPLMYLAYSRVPAGRDDVLATAQALLRAGADPNAGRYFAGYPTPFTVLTGVFGGGEGDEPPHLHEAELADLLLRAGADPNDAQTLYNRQFGPDDSFLRVLLPAGLGTGDGGPWRRRLPDLTPAPAELLRRLLAWAVVHDQRDRVALLARHGVDLAASLPGLPASGRTPHAAALVNGHRELAAQLVAAGAPSDELTGADAAVAALLAGDRSGVAELPPAALAEARSARPGLPVWAAAVGHGEAVELVVEHGWDVDARGRDDVPLDEPWQTALHTAVAAGDGGLVTRLLALGADPTVTDARFHADAAGWAEFFGHRHLLALLGGGTRPGASG